MNPDKVLAELDRRIALAENATPGPWLLGKSNNVYANIESASHGKIASAITLGANDSDSEFIADAGTHRLAELNTLKEIYLKALYWEDVQLASTIWHAILGADK